MKVRSALTPSEVLELQGEIGRRLQGLGLATQPAVASRILGLVSDPDAGLRQFAEVLRADAAISGRMLRLANSALFAQVRAVTTLERACVILGLERVKAVSLGFYLSRGAAMDPSQVIARRVWSQSLMRACLAAELARVICPGRAAEAFTVGLMLDVGAPLLVRILGKSAERVLSSGKPPAEQFAMESETLPFTHVDVAGAIVRKWALPEILARPIEWHHAPPGDVERHEPVHVLHRIAWCVGSLALGRSDTGQETFREANLGALRLTAQSLGRAIRGAADEYSALKTFFRDVADDAGDLASIAESVHAQLISVMDRSLAESLREETVAAPAEFTIGGSRVEIEPGRGGRAVAYLRDEKGERIVSHIFDAGMTGAGPLLDALGLDGAAPEQTRELEQHLRSLAA